MPYLFSRKHYNFTTLVIPPEKPVIHVDTVDNVIRVPAGTDYTVSCTSYGFPAPFIRWTDREGNVKPTNSYFFNLSNLENQ
jgi:hypothetical protein